jgi:hypothetical protein
MRHVGFFLVAVGGFISAPAQDFGGGPRVSGRGLSLLGGDRVSVGGYELVIGGVHFALRLPLTLGEALKIGEVLAAPQPLSAG